MTVGRARLGNTAQMAGSNSRSNLRGVSPVPSAANNDLFSRHGRLIFAHVDRALRPRHNPAHHRNKRLKWHGVVIRIEGVLIVTRAKSRRSLIRRMATELLAHVPIEPEIVE